MVCSLPSPQWTNLSQPGIQSAIENLADGTVVLQWNSALPTGISNSVYYLIYYSVDRSTLFDSPKAVTTSTQISVPKNIADTTNYFAVRASQLGATNNFSSVNLVEISEGLYSFPSQTTLRLSLGVADGYVAVDSTIGFPLEDGYIKVEDEVILYSEITSYMGGPAFVIESRDPFSCNDITAHVADGYLAVGFFEGFSEKNIKSFRPQESFSFVRPEWVNLTKIGLQTVEDLGIGQSLQLEWDFARVPSGFSKVHYNIYRSDSAYSLLANNPFGLTTQNSVIDPNLQAGDGYYYSVRATYFFDDINFGNFQELSDGFYQFPLSTSINEADGYLSVGETGSISVLSTEGYPDSGQLKIRSEVVTYSSKTPTSFVISERDVLETNRVSEYPNGTSVSFFKGIEDGNNVFWRNVPTWDSGKGIRIFPPTPGDGYDGYQYLQDADGYRNFPVDNITEDHSDFEDSNEDFESLDYCGFRSETFVPLYEGDRCGTFHGGQQYRVVPGVNNGEPVPVGGGINVFDRNIQRQEFLLGLTGESFVLLRRKWTGQTCPRISLRHEHPHARCGLCFGTTFFGGYDRYFNDRMIRPGENNPNGFIQVRITPYIDDLLLHPERGLTQENVNIEGWTLAIPTIKDRDILIKYIVNRDTGLIEEEFRYEVLSVQRNKLTLGAEGAQKLTMKRLNKTEEIYKFSAGLV